MEQGGQGGVASGLQLQAKRFAPQRTEGCKKLRKDDRLEQTTRNVQGDGVVGGNDDGDKDLVNPGKRRADGSSQQAWGRP
nr:hypothetical protein Iba_chr11cCG8970 [Ipomoea batatas]